MNRIELEYLSKDGLNRELYTFILLGNNKLTLDRYSRDNRQTKRHGWKVQEVYCRISSETRRYNFTVKILTKAPYSVSLIEDAKNKFMQSITVVI